MNGRDDIARSERLADVLLDAIEHGCKVTKKQLDDRCWGWAQTAASITDDLTCTFLRVVATDSTEGGSDV